MIIPKLKKIKSEKKYHDILLKDEYAWVDQPNILEVLKDANKLDPAVKDFICLLYTSPSPRDLAVSRMPSSA